MKERSRERTKVSNTCAPPEPKNGTIQSFFNGTARVKKKSVPCPICQKEVELSKINAHMDSQECSNESISPCDEESSVIDLTICDSKENNIAQKRKSTENHDLNKRFKNSFPISRKNILVFAVYGNNENSNYILNLTTLTSHRSIFPY